jgi:hypothetical protein
MRRGVRERAIIGQPHTWARCLSLATILPPVRYFAKAQNPSSTRPPCFWVTCIGITNAELSGYVRSPLSGVVPDRRKPSVMERGVRLLGAEHLIQAVYRASVLRPNDLRISCGPSSPRPHKPTLP